MGYNTDFDGHLTIVPPLNQHEMGYLREFALTRHVNRTNGPYFVRSTFVAGDDSDVIDYNEHTPGQPGLWCKWVPDADGTALVWNEEEKFYYADLWVAYLIDTFLKQAAAVALEHESPVPGRVYPETLGQFTFDHVVNGVVEAQGDDEHDRWRIEVRDNTVYVIKLLAEPDHGDISPTYPSYWSDELWAEFYARTRHNFVFVVRDGRLEEVGPADGTDFEPISGGSE